ncbi:GIP, partial [Symbiodinium sp. CCMP2456]
MELVMELEKKLLEKNTKELESRLFSLAVDEDRCWTDYLNGYLMHGAVEDGWKSVFSCPALNPFDDVDKTGLVVNWDPKKYDVWSSMKRALPLPRRVRKRLFSSSSWVVAFTRDKSRKDPIMNGNYGDATVLRVDYEMEQNMEVLKLLTWAVAAGRVVSVVGTDEPVQARSLALQTWVYVMAKTFGCGVLRGGFLTTTATDEDLALNLTTSLQVVMGMYEVPLGATSDGKEWIGFTDMNEMRTLRGMAVSGEARQPLPPELHQLRRSMGLVDENKLKYMLVGAYRIPKSLLTEGELPREESGMDKLEKDDPLEGEEDDLADY